MALNTCIVTANLTDMTGASFSSAELVCEPRKSVVSSTADQIVISKPMRASAVSGVASLTLVETTTTAQKVIFTINYNDGNNFGTIVFDPCLIPNQTSINLADLVTVSRG